MIDAAVADGSEVSSFFFFSSRRRHTRSLCDWSSDVCSSDLVIQSGESTLQIADDLQAKGLIRNALAFRVWARIKGLDTHLQAGAYNLDTSMTIDAIIGPLLNAPPD